MREILPATSEASSLLPLLIPECHPDDMRTLVNSSFCSMEYQVVPGKASPMTSMRGAGFGAGGGVGVFQHDGQGTRVGRRDRRHIRANWADDFVITMPISARVRTEHRGTVANLDPGSFVFLSTSKPFSAELSGGHREDPFSLFLVRVSGPMLRERVPQIDLYCGSAHPVRAGAGKIMQGLFNLALSDGTVLSTAQNGSFGDILLTAIANVAAEMAESSAVPTQRKPASARVREQAVDYIVANLSNPELDSDLVARHCQVSARYIQAAFAASATTVEAYIREARLLQCRESLRHPALKYKSIIEIAMSWGFNDAAHFSRTYKQRFGNSPSSERK